MMAVQAGVGREKAHEIIKEHAVSTALAMRERGIDRNDLLERLANDSRLNLDKAALNNLFDKPLQFTGAAQTQVQAFIRQVEALVKNHPEAAFYEPESML